MATDPVTVQSFASNREALEAQDFLKQHDVASFLFLESSWVDREGAPELSQNVLLVTRPPAAPRARAILQRRTAPAPPIVHQPRSSSDGKFFRWAGWMLVVFFVFYVVSSLRDGIIDSVEILPAGIFLTAAVFFFLMALYSIKKPAHESHQPV